MNKRIGDLSVQDLSGVGPAFTDILLHQGVATIAELSACSAEKLAKASSKYSVAQWVAHIGRAEVAVQAQWLLDGLPGKRVCAACQGAGDDVVVKETREVCAACQGKGVTSRTREGTCDNCAGAGTLTRRELRGCSTCGGSGSITVKRDVVCLECAGQGTRPRPCIRTHMVQCPRCKGSGVPMIHYIVGGILLSPLYIAACIGMGYRCAKCNGEGEVKEKYPSTIYESCQACGGDGVAVEDVTVSCPECGGAKKVVQLITTACKICNKKGVKTVREEVTCSSCLGSGENVEISSISVPCRVCGGGRNFFNGKPIPRSFLSPSTFIFSEITQKAG